MARGGLLGARVKLLLHLVHIISSPARCISQKFVTILINSVWSHICLASLASWFDFGCVFFSPVSSPLGFSCFLGALSPPSPSPRLSAKTKSRIWQPDQTLCFFRRLGNNKRTSAQYSSVQLSQLTELSQSCFLCFGLGFKTSFSGASDSYSCSSWFVQLLCWCFADFCWAPGLLHLQQSTKYRCCPSGVPSSVAVSFQGNRGGKRVSGLEKILGASNSGHSNPLVNIITCQRQKPSHGISQDGTGPSERWRRSSVQICSRRSKQC